MRIVSDLRFDTEALAAATPAQPGAVQRVETMARLDVAALEAAFASANG